MSTGDSRTHRVAPCQPSGKASRTDAQGICSPDNLSVPPPAAGASGSHLAPVGRQAALDQELVRFRAHIATPAVALGREVRLLLASIHEHIFDPELNVQSVKRRCGILDNNVSSRFYYEMGTSIRAYIETMRMQAATALLKNCSLTVYEVSRAVGYSHPQTFYRTFRRLFRRTPGQRATRGAHGHRSEGASSASADQRPPARASRCCR